MILGRKGDEDIIKCDITMKKTKQYNLYMH